MTFKSSMSSEAYDLLDELSDKIRDDIRDLVEDVAKNRGSFLENGNTVKIEIEDVKKVEEKIGMLFWVLLNE